MKTPFFLVLILAMSAGGCSSIERSRSLSNPATPATTIAQQVCSNCHGIDGNAVSPNFPNLAAQQKTYFIAQLKGFRGHDRLDPEGFEYMWGLSRSLTDDQIEGLAAYFAAQKPVASVMSSTPMFSKGEQIFRKGLPDQSIPACASCHGDHAQGNEGFPRLANQHALYVYRELTVYQRTDERPAGTVMKVIAHNLTPNDMQAVSEFLQSFPKDPQ